MDIWIIRNGEKTGPIHDYEIRHKIEDRELSFETPAWHEGLESWRPLGEMDLFKREFDLLDRPATAEHPLPEPSPASSVPPPLPQKPVWIRRFWARWFDLYLYAGVWWLCMWAARRDIESALVNPWLMILLYVPWFVFEAFLIQRIGTTPGKWLLGLKVTNLDGSLLNLPQSVRRSARVLFTGVGFGWQLLALFCQALSYFTAKRVGSPLWDYVGGHRVAAAPLNPIRVVAFVIFFFGAIQLQMIVVSPYVMKEAVERFPALKEKVEENPPWHLPKRS
jgi:hypothetical protein